MIHTEETRRNLSEKRKGKNNPFYGKKHTEATKKIMAAASRKLSANRTFAINDMAIKIPSGNDLYYLAGIIDGEGSIRFVKGRPFVAVYNGNVLLMKWLQRNIGGKVGGYDKRGREINYTWRIDAAKDVYWLCIALWDCLIIKQDDADKVITFLKNKYGNRIENTVDNTHI